MDNCLFCKIVRGEIPSNKVYEDERVLAFRDIDPQAPVHVLLIPKQHFASILDVDVDTFGYMQTIVKKLADELGIAEKGFRVVVNTGEDGQQSVKHLHFHILGGRSMQWPPG
ncbi:MAG: histidine triad nucleotide-binding protein [Eubacteriales bacterium]|nr:histidine triad nucleotide-binding protein [Clostridium sp.]MDY6089157.1 histidine triad nucleotide-binding protein [Eubacteriales bacterium]